MTNVIRTTLMLAGLTGLLLLFGGFVGGRSGIFLAPPHSSHHNTIGDIKGQGVRCRERNYMQESIF